MNDRTEARIAIVKRELNEGALAGFDSTVTDQGARLVVTALEEFDGKVQRLTAAIPAPAMEWSDMWHELTGYVHACAEDGHQVATDIQRCMRDLEKRRRQPIGDWMRGLQAGA